MTDVWQNLAGQETAKRAIEIAMVGSLPITFVPQDRARHVFTQYDIDRLRGDNRKKAQAMYDGYDGEPTSLAAALDTVAHVRAIADDLAARCGLPALDTTHNTAAMRIDIMPISCADFVIPPPAEGVERVVARVMAAIEKLPSITGDLTPEAQALRDNWLRYVPTAPVDKAIEIARCIAAFGGGYSSDARQGGPQITRLCLAEAISYCRR